MFWRLFKMHFGFTKPTLKEKILHAIYRLQTQLSKLEETSAKLHQRDKEMFERCVGAKAAGDDARAAIYANECAEIRKMAKIILLSQLAIEKVILRLQTIEDVGDLLVQMAPVVGIIKETKGKLSGIIPEVAYELEEINKMLDNTLLETGKTIPQEVPEETVSNEAKKVLEEAAALAEQKINEHYPKLPIPPEPTPIEQPVQESIPATSTTETVESTETVKEEIPEKIVYEEKIPSLPLEQLEEEVLNYIKQHGGEISLSQCASTFNITVEDVKKIISKLENEGKIIIQ